MIKGIEHAGLAAKNPDTLAAWYRDTLGMKVRSTNNQGVWFMEDERGGMIEIYPAKSDGERVKDNYVSGWRHLAIEVRDFDAEVENLKKKGIPLDGAPTVTEKAKLGFFRDPEGNLCHLVERIVPLG